MYIAKEGILTTIKRNCTSGMPGKSAGNCANFTVFSFLSASNNKKVCAIFGCYVSSGVKHIIHSHVCHHWKYMGPYVLLLQPMNFKSDANCIHRWQNTKTFNDGRRLC